MTTQRLILLGGGHAHIHVLARAARSPLSGVELVLDFNLRAALAGRPLHRYRPQPSFLALMNSADGRAIWRWHALAGHSRAAWWIKNRTDRAYVRRNQRAWTNQAGSAV